MTAVFVDSARVRRHFARVAATYDQADFFEREIDRRMQERLDAIRLTPRRIVDVGCGRGASLTGLLQRYPKALALGIDIVPAMLPRPRWRPLSAQPRFAAADALRLPLAGASVELFWSNLLLPWLDDPWPALAEAHRVLADGGLLMFSTLGPDTLKELRGAFPDAYPHVQRGLDLHDLGDLLTSGGFAGPVMDMDMIRLTYGSLKALTDELRAAGATCAMRPRRPGLTGRQTWAAVREHYESLRHEGKLPATFEVIYGHAWKAPPRKTSDGHDIVRMYPPALRQSG